MKIAELKSPVSVINGAGAAAVKCLAKLNIFTVGELLTYYPKDYEDRRKKIELADFAHHKINTIAKVNAHEWFGYGKMKTLKILIQDKSTSAALIAFNRPFLQSKLTEGSIIAVYGEFSEKYGQIQSSSFEVEKLADDGNLDDYENIIIPNSKIMPIYPLTEGLSQKNLRKMINFAINSYTLGLEDEIPEEIITKRNLLSKQKAIRLVHNPKSIEDLEKARHTLIYEELFKLQCTIAERTLKHKGSFITEKSQNIDDNKNQENESQLKIEFEKSLSPLQTLLNKKINFTLTKDQMKSIMVMNEDIDKGYIQRSKILNGEENYKYPFTMNRLLQGDVGSGKTLAAFFAALRIISWKGQCAFMAPTEILARQHAENAAKILAPLGVKIAFLTGNVKAKGRTMLLEQLKKGEIDIIVGTQALFSPQTIYNDLQLVIIDEQHRFGVVQRQTIVNKGRKNENGQIFEPHLLMMSATPIPQTLALTVLGDFDISSIKTIPANRKPIITHLVREGNERNAYEAVRKLLAKGEQAYFVYPAIESSEYIGETKAAEDMFKRLSKDIYPEFSSALIHSKIEDDEQITILNDFKNGKIKILAATTVIEVGIDIPNATSIVIEYADRFGLAQLHQLRGRVGRGEKQSYCFLIYSKNITESGKERMKVLHTTCDGFEIAEKDLKLRGPGEITGTLQAGNLTLAIADLCRDNALHLQAKSDAFYFMQHKLQDGAF